MNYNNNRIFKCNSIFCCFGNKGKQVGVYMAGMLFAMGWWVFVDGLLVLGNLENRQVVPGIEDWVPGILTSLGLIIVNLIDKETLRGTGYYDDDYIWRARLFLFLGFALLAGGFSGSVSVLVTKYIYHDGLDISNQYLGIADVVQNALIMLSCAVLWLAQSSQYQEYNQI